MGSANHRTTGQRGFSLIEVLFATAISSVSILGLMAMTVVSIKANQRDSLRNDSVRVASETAEILMTAPFDTVESCESPASSGTTSAGTTSSGCHIVDAEGDDILPDPDESELTVSNTPDVPYDLSWTVTELSDDLKEIEIKVDYPDNIEVHEHKVTIYKHREI